MISPWRKPNLISIGNILSYYPVTQSPETTSSEILTKIKKSMHPKVMLGVIHNNEIDRLEYLRPKVDYLLKNRLIDFTYAEISEQNKITYSLPIMVKHILANLKLKKDMKELYVLLLSLIRNITNKTQFISTLNVTKSRLIAETQLALKHKQTYEKFFESNCEFLLVLESDAIFFDSSLFIPELISGISLMQSNCILVLGGTYSLQELKLNSRNNFKYKDYMIHEIPGIHTNTTVAFLIDRQIAKILIENWPKTIYSGPVDWLIKRIAEKARLENSKSLFFDPPRVINGSATDYYESEIQKK